MLSHFAALALWDLATWPLVMSVTAPAERPRPGVATHLKPHVHNTQNPTRSALEDDFIAFCQIHGLPIPETNTIVAGREADAYFPAQRLIVELDGYAFHSDRQAFERDRANDAEGLRQGIATLRLTSERLTDPEAERLRTILAQRTP